MGIGTWVCGKGPISCMKQKVRDEYLGRVKLVAKSKLYGRNLIKAINAWAVGVVRYSAGILDWSDRELKEMDVKTRKVDNVWGLSKEGEWSKVVHIKETWW